MIDAGVSTLHHHWRALQEFKCAVIPRLLRVPSMQGRDESWFELQAFLDAGVDALIIISANGEIERFNRSAERMFGYSADEMLGRNISALMTASDVGRHDSYIGRYLETGVAHIIGVGREVQALRRDGSVFPVALSVGRVAGSNPPRFVGFLQDITVRRQAMAALQQERDRANRYLEAVQTMLVALSPDRLITLINRKGCEILGSDEPALRGSDWFEHVVAPEHRLRAVAEFAAMLANPADGPQHCEYDVICRNGERRQIVWRCVVVSDVPGHATGVLCSGDDVTHSRRAERDAREANDRMMHVSRLATMGEMATGISHELNQPLTAIASFADAGRRLLQQGESGREDVAEALLHISAQALRAGEIIRRLRELVRNRETRHEAAQINEVIEELNLLARADALAHDVRIQFALAAGLPELLLDRIQIQQVLLNLVRNAIEAVAELPGERRELRISTGLLASGDVEVLVADRGTGVAAPMIARLFTPFATNKANGTGLGLAISRTIVEAHHGTLTFRNLQPYGACFIIHLPASPEKAR